jgi:hypothetical protein
LEPQATMPPQPSGTVPQSFPAGQLVAGLQPQMLSVPPPPHVSNPVQPPQLMKSPQPSDTKPH